MSNQMSRNKMELFTGKYFIYSQPRYELGDLLSKYYSIWVIWSKFSLKQVQYMQFFLATWYYLYMMDI